jgi:ribosomal protein S27AE
MSTPITLPKRNAGHLTPRGEVCCNETFNVESSGIGSGARAFCSKCGAEVVIAGNKTITFS